MKTTMILAAIALVGLSACGRQPANAAADEKVLCDPSTGKAYFVRPGAGDTSFIKPNAAMDGLCKKA